jgi:hypothetical protein
MGNDQATSAGLGAVAADQAVSDSTIQGLSAVAAIGRGEKATAVEGMQRAAQMSGAQAKADAENSLQSQIGDAGLAGKIVGTGAALWNPTASTDLAVRDPRAGVRGQRGYGQP